MLERPIKVNRILTTSTEHARAIEDPARAKTIEILYRRALSAEQITKELKKFGHKKALTTVRHHLDILREAGLIEVVKIDESRGGMTKFYSTSTKMLVYDPPTDFQDRYSKLIASTSAKVEKILKGINPKPASGKNAKSDELSQHLLMEIMNRAITNVLESQHEKSK